MLGKIERQKENAVPPRNSPRDVNMKQRQGSIFKNPKPTRSSELRAEGSVVRRVTENSCSNCGALNNKIRLDCRICGAQFKKTFQPLRTPNEASSSSLSRDLGSATEWKHLRRENAFKPAATTAQTATDNTRDRAAEERQQRELLNQILKKNGGEYIGFNGNHDRAESFKNASEEMWKSRSKGVPNIPPMKSRRNAINQPFEVSDEMQRRPTPWAVWKAQPQDQENTQVTGSEYKFYQSRKESRDLDKENLYKPISSIARRVLNQPMVRYTGGPKAAPDGMRSNLDQTASDLHSTALNNSITNDAAEDPLVTEQQGPIDSQDLDQRAKRRARRFAIEQQEQASKTAHTRNFIRMREREDQQQYNDRFEDEEDSIESHAQRKQRRKQEKLAKKASGPPTPIILPEFISIGNLATALHVRTEEFMQKMVSLGFEETNGDYVLDAETAGLIATEFNFEPIVERRQDEDLVAQPPAEDKSNLPSRPPVVTIMGHVDHGKTTLLDYLRKSSVAASEHGGITQHIGAFKVSMPSGKVITFLDTPGHAAFLDMRQRGANVTDIVILVVAADDSVKPQTIEAIKHAQAAKVPMIVAINKVDKVESNVERVKQDLARHDVHVEDYGGETQVVCVSGKTGLGMNELEDATTTLADVLDMRAETDGQAEGWVLEATTKQKGRIATILVRRGTMYIGNIIVAGTTWAKVRTMRNEAGVSITAAGPGTPVEIDGWREQPKAGDEVLQANDEQHAKTVVQIRLERAEITRLSVDMTAINESRRIEQEKREQDKSASEEKLAEHDSRQASPKAHLESPTGVKDVFFVVKADVSGSVEAVVNSVSALGNEEVRANVLRATVGSASESDIELAAAARGHMICFNVPIEQSIVRKAEAAGVRILDQNIIYKLIDDVKARLSEQLGSSVTVRVLGEAEIVQVFQINTKGRTTTNIAGCKVRNGVVSRTAKTRVLRDRKTVYSGMLL